MSAATALSTGDAIIEDATLLGYQADLEAGIDYKLFGFLDLGLALPYSHKGLVDTSDSSSGLDIGRAAGALRLGVAFPGDQFPLVVSFSILSSTLSSARVVLFIRTTFEPESP